MVSFFEHLDDLVGTFILLVMILTNVRSISPTRRFQKGEAIHSRVSRGHF
jgi:hypothetical protein